MFEGLAEKFGLGKPLESSKQPEKELTPAEEIDVIKERIATIKGKEVGEGRLSRADRHELERLRRLSEIIATRIKQDKPADPPEKL